MNGFLTIYKCKIPLTKPYHLAFSSVYHFDTFFCKFTNEKGDFWGETTTLQGYSWEKPEVTWISLKQWIEIESISKLKKQLKIEQKTSPFAVSCINSALEQSEKTLKNEKITAPLVGIISSTKNEEIKQQLFNQISEGYTTIKVKVQGNLNIDQPKLEFIQQILPSSIKIRIDANQSYNYNDAVKLVSILNPEKVELFEQPFKPNEWIEMAELNKISPVKLMLDESIWTEEHIKRTRNLNCADFVKLKLFKHGSIKETERLINLANKLNLKVVFGNGVQSDLGCYYEALVYNKLKLTTAGEFNGYLKQKNSVTKNLIFNNGKITTVEQPEWNEKMISNFIQESKQTKLKLS